MLRHYIILFFSLSALWMALSGQFSLHHPLVAITGLLSCLVVTWLARRMDIHDLAWSPMRLHYGRLLAATAWMYKEILIANLDVSRRIFRYLQGDKSAISPAMRRLPITQTMDASRVIHANSITLTPGTVSVYVEKDEIIIHALTQSGADSYQDGMLDEKITRLEAQQERT